MVSIMRTNDFRRAGHTPSLVAALLHFDISFAIWVILGALGAYIADDLGLSGSQKGVLVAVPLLSAAVCRVTFGVLADRFGPRRIGTISMLIAITPLLWAARPPAAAAVRRRCAHFWPRRPRSGSRPCRSNPRKRLKCSCAGPWKSVEPVVTSPSSRAAL